MIPFAAAGLITCAVAILLEPGAETTTNALEIFVLAARLHPEIIKLAQAELDAVVGSSRLPMIADVKLLPYIGAIVKETLRRRPVTPSGVPYLNIEENEYIGYRIPKGSVVTANLWGIHLNPDVYASPNSFRPERWLGDEAAETLEHSAFGFGRHACTGKHIATNSHFFNIATLRGSYGLATLDRK